MKEPVLLIPGMMCDARVFAAQIDALARTADVRVADISGSATIYGLGRTVLEQAPWRTFSVAGLSMGGIVAMELVRVAPERIARLALIDTNQRAEIRERQQARLGQIKRAFDGELRRLLIDEMKPLYLAPENRAREDILDTVLEMALDLGPLVFERQSIALRDRPDSTATLRTVACPTLVLCGRHDTLCPVDRHEEMAALVAGARLVVVEGAGHLTTLEQPEAVNAALNQWLTTS